MWKVCFFVQRKMSGDEFDCYVPYANHTIQLGAHRRPAVDKNMKVDWVGTWNVKQRTRLWDLAHFVWIKLTLRQVIITQKIAW